jgi:hypothetical protein
MVNVLAQRIGSGTQELLYELLDAHDDTVRLAAGPQSDLRWRAHLDYLRQLQRVGREALAHMTVAEPSARRRS